MDTPKGYQSLPDLDFDKSRRLHVPGDLRKERIQADIDEERLTIEGELRINNLPQTTVQPALQRFEFFNELPRSSDRSIQPASLRSGTYTSVQSHGQSYSTGESEYRYNPLSSPVSHSLPVAKSPVLNYDFTVDQGKNPNNLNFFGFDF